MKSFQDNSFVNAFHRILAKTRPTPLSKRWNVDGVAWQWDKHAFLGQEHSYNTEIYVLKSLSARPWTLMVVFDTWRYGEEDTVVRQAHWSKLLQGQRAEVFAWLRRQESKLL